MKQETEWRNLFKLCLLNINTVYFKGEGGQSKKTKTPKHHRELILFVFFNTSFVYIPFEPMLLLISTKSWRYFAVQNCTVLV